MSFDHNLGYHGRMPWEGVGMELEQLRQLDTIARRGTISAAAEELHISQPALSRSIRRLERELGQELFDRTHNSATLNDAGRLAVDHARNLLRDERMMLDAFADLARRQRTLLVGTVAPAPVWHLTALTVERFPGTLLNPVTLPEDEVERRLMNRSVDLAITLRPQILPTMRSTQIMAETSTSVRACPNTPRKDTPRPRTFSTSCMPWRTRSTAPWVSSRSRG